jgi:hypothetical protein
VLQRQLLVRPRTTAPTAGDTSDGYLL